MRAVSNVPASPATKYTVLKPFTSLGKAYEAGDEFRPSAKTDPRRLRLMVEARLIVPIGAKD